MLYVHTQYFTPHFANLLQFARLSGQHRILTSAIVLDARSSMHRNLPNFGIGGGRWSELAHARGRKADLRVLAIDSGAGRKYCSVNIWEVLRRSEEY